MRAVIPKFAVDTNIYIGSLRSAEARAAMTDFVDSYAPRCYVLSIVMLELFAGAPNASELERYRRLILRPYRRLRRILTPSREAVIRAGELIARLRWKGERAAGPVHAAFISDVLIAQTCAEHGVVLVTDNTRDFRLLAEHVPGLRYAAPWP